VFVTHSLYKAWHDAGLISHPAFPAILKTWLVGTGCKLKWHHKDPAAARSRPDSPAADHFTVLAL
jgi:hypothetical protein